MANWAIPLAYVAGIISFLGAIIAWLGVYIISKKDKDQDDQWIEINKIKGDIIKTSHLEAFKEKFENDVQNLRALQISEMNSLKEEFKLSRQYAEKFQENVLNTMNKSFDRIVQIITANGNNKNGDS